MSQRRALVVGSTGLLGGWTTRLLLEGGMRTRALVRPSASPEARSSLAQRGAELVAGDLTHTPSLVDACRDVSVVVSTATSILSQQPGDTIQSVDEEGQLALIGAAERAGVEHFVFVSFQPTEIDSPLERAKQRVEARLRGGALSYTILQPVYFMEVWLSPMVGFNPVAGKVTILGDGKHPVSWMSVRDVARFAVAATEGGLFASKVLPLGGPEALSPLKVLEIFREMGVPDVQAEYMTDASLRQEWETATDPRGKTFAALKLRAALGQIVDPGPALALVPGRLGSVRDYATDVLKHSKSS